MEQMQDICRGSVGPLERTQGSAMRPNSRWSGTDWWMLKFVFVYLANTVVLCYSLTIICCCQMQDYIYWIISTENDHRHHHKYEKRLRKEGKNMLGLQCTYQAKSLPLQREFGRIALPWVRSTTCGSWAKEQVSTRGRKRALTASERKMNRSEVSSKWGSVGPLEWTQGSDTRPNSHSKWQRFCLVGKPSMFFPSFLNRFSYFMNLWWSFSVDIIQYM
jgi:hypothetical protein